MYTNFPLVDIDYRYGGVSNAYVIDLSQGGGGGVTRKRPLVKWVSAKIPLISTVKPPLTFTSLV